MAHICAQRQAELDVVLEYGRELGTIGDGSPVVRDEYRFRGVQGHHRLDLSGVKSLEQRWDNTFGFSWEWKVLGHQGSPVRVGGSCPQALCDERPLTPLSSLFARPIPSASRPAPRAR